jgi:hypothetical protein
VIFHFVLDYTSYIAEIREVANPEFNCILDELEAIDPHGNVSPDTWFPND